MRWLAPYTWLALLGTATLSANCAIGARTAVCTDSQGTAELFADAACNLCASEACCAPATACGAGSVCVEVASCMRECASAGGDPSCISGCKARSDFDPDLIGDVVDCLAGAECGASCSPPEIVAAPACPDAGTIPDALGPSCGACIRRLACADAVTCANDPTCAARLECMAESCQGPALDATSGMTPGCFDNCRRLVFDPNEDEVRAAREGDAPQRADTAFFSAAADVCSVECRIGRELSCVDGHDWPRAASDEVLLQRIVQDRVGGKGVPDLDVTACFPGPGDCSAITSTATDAEGFVQLTVPTTITEFDPRSGFRGYLELLNGDSPPAEVEWRDTILIHTRPEWRDRIADEIDPYAADNFLRTILESIASNAQVELDFYQDDPGTGVLVGGMVDCRGRTEFFVPNARLVIDDAPGAVIRYVNEAQLGVERDATATTRSGQFIVINVPEGAHSVSMVDAFTGRTLASESEVKIGAGKLTVIQFYPQAR